MCVLVKIVLVVPRPPSRELMLPAWKWLLCFKNLRILVVLPTTPCILLFRVGALEAPGVEVAVVVVLIITIGLGQLHDGLGVGAHGGQRDGDRVEPERGEERQAGPLQSAMIGVARAEECYDNDAEAVGRDPVPPLPSRFVLSTHPRHQAGLAVAHD